MWNELVGQYLKSADGNDLLEQLQTRGLTAQQATQSVTATAEAASGAPAAGLSGIASALMGGAAPGAGMANSIAQVVAQKTGLALPMAQTVVSMVLPKVMSLFSGAPGNAPRAPSATGGILGMLR